MLEYDALGLEQKYGSGAERMAEQIRLILDDRRSHDQVAKLTAIDRILGGRGVVVVTLKSAPKRSSLSFATGTVSTTRATTIAYIDRGSRARDTILSMDSRFRLSSLSDALADAGRRGFSIESTR